MFAIFQQFPNVPKELRVIHAFLKEAALTKFSHKPNYNRLKNILQHVKPCRYSKKINDSFDIMSTGMQNGEKENKHMRKLAQILQAEKYPHQIAEQYAN